MLFLLFTNFMLYRKITQLLVSLFAIVFILGFISQFFVREWHNPSDGFPYLSQSNSVATFTQKISQTWDTKHFTAIPEGGYANEDLRLNHKNECGEDKKCGLGPNYLYAFFPLFPIQIKLFSTVFGLVGGLFVVALINYFWFSNKLTQILQLLSDKKDLFSILLIALLMPFSVFFALPYTESLYLAIFLSIIIILKRQKVSFQNSGLIFILSFLLGLSRSVAVILPLTLGLYLLFRLFQLRFNIVNFWLKYKTIILHFIAVSGGVGLAFLSFFYYGYTQTGNFWVSRDVQDLWNRGSTLNIFEPYFRGLMDIFIGKHFGVGVIFTTLFIILSIWVWQNYKHKVLSDITYFILYFYSIFAVILPLTSNSTASINRYILATPIYFIFTPILLYKLLSRLKPWVYWVFVFALFVFFCFTAVLWTNHYWIG